MGSFWGLYGLLTVDLVPTTVDLWSLSGRCRVETGCSVDAPRSFFGPPGIKNNLFRSTTDLEKHRKTISATLNFKAWTFEWTNCLNVEKWAKQKQIEIIKIASKWKEIRHPPEQHIMNDCVSTMVKVYLYIRSGQNNKVLCFEPPPLYHVFYLLRHKL